MAPIFQRGTGRTCMNARDGSKSNGWYPETINKEDEMNKEIKIAEVGDNITYWSIGFSTIEQIGILTFEIERLKANLMKEVKVVENTGDVEQ